MKLSWGDVLAGILVVAGGVITFAKLQSYDWWLLGSWKGALGVLSVIGLAILLTNVVEIFKIADMTVFVEMLLWLSAATVAVGSMFAVTTKMEFVSTAVLVGVSWVAQFGRHLWVSTHEPHTPRYMPMH